MSPHTQDDVVPRSPLRLAHGVPPFRTAHRICAILFHFEQWIPSENTTSQQHIPLTLSKRCCPVLSQVMGLVALLYIMKTHNFGADLFWRVLTGLSILFRFSELIWV